LDPASAIAVEDPGDEEVDSGTAITVAPVTAVTTTTTRGTA
jgi:hypothetical protein